MRLHHLQAPLTAAATDALRSGDRVRISGRIITARDAAHRRLIELIERGEPLPVDLEGQVLYYVGPTPAPPGRVIGSAGPTTSGRVDRFTPVLLERGLRAMIGKGYRSQEVKEAIVRHRAVYLVATGGTGAILARSIRATRILAWPDLGTEAIRELEVHDFPAVVIHDMFGGDYYAEGQRAYRR